MKNNLSLDDPTTCCEAELSYYARKLISMGTALNYDYLDYLAELKQVVCEKAHNDPGYMNNSPSYIAQDAYWKVLNLHSHKKVNEVPFYEWEIEMEKNNTSLSSSRPVEEQSLTSCITDEIFNSLNSDREEAVVTLIYAGFSISEIIESLGVKRLVYYRTLNKVRKATSHLLEE